MMPACEPALSHPKPCASVKQSLRILPFRRFYLALGGRKEAVVTVVRDELFSQNPTPIRAFESRAQQFSTSLGRRRSSYLPPSSNQVLTHPIQRATVRMRLLRLPTRLSATGSLASREPSPAEHQIGDREEARRVYTILNQSNRRHVPTDRLNRVQSQLVPSLEDESCPTPAGKALPAYLKTRFWMERNRR